MTGATARNRGLRWERDVANYLSAQLNLEVVTARSVSGGTQIGSDLVTLRRSGMVQHHVLGFSLETKASKNAHQPTPWLRQAREQANGHNYAVIAKQMQKPTEDAIVYVGVPGGLVPQVGGEGPHWMSLAWFVELLHAFRGAET